MTQVCAPFASRAYNLRKTTLRQRGDGKKGMDTRMVARQVKATAWNRGVIVYEKDGSEHKVTAKWFGFVVDSFLDGAGGETAAKTLSYLKLRAKLSASRCRPMRIARGWINSMQRGPKA
jgi:hypothetical protein